MTSPPQHILVTGAKGFVAKHLIAQLTAVYSSAILYTPSFDLRDRDAVATIVRNFAPDVCIHLAAVSAIPVAEQDEEQAWQVNLHGTLHLAHAILRYAPNCQLLFASSADAYGWSFQSGIALAENAPLAPRSTYAATKAAADLALGSMAERGLCCVRLRPVNHTGPGQSDQFVVAAFARQIARIVAGLQPPLLKVGNVDTWRDFLDVRDVCAAYLACIHNRSKLASGTILNLASGKLRRIGDILTDLLVLAGTTAEVQIDPGRWRGRDVRSACSDSTQARNLLNWTPVIPWEQTLRDVLDDWRARVQASEDT